LRLVRFRDLLHVTLRACACDLIAYEDAAFGSPNPSTQAMHNELRGIIKLVAAEAGGKATVGYTPTAIKKFATGDGRAKKPAMIAAYARHYPQQQIIDDNHADALWLLRFAEHRASEEQTHGVAITKKKRRAPMKR
jgi:Holliday junction resolvasome RuvABC endonuclease subunit